MSNLSRHAERELDRVGLTGKTGEPWDDKMRESVMEIVEVFSNQGHSGYSAATCIALLTELLDFKPLSPVTSDPDEWLNICQYAINGEELWQNTRDSECFSNDGGRTYYRLSERRSGIRKLLHGEYPIHTAVVSPVEATK